MAWNYSVSPTTTVTNAQGLAIDNISITSSGPINLPVTPTCPPNLTTATGLAASANVSATDGDGIVTSATLTSVTPSPATGSITLGSFTPAGVIGGTASAVLNVDSSVPVGTYSALITWTNNDSPTAQTATCTVVVTVSPITKISAIQGSGETPPLAGSAVVIEGIVVGDFQGSNRLAGFFVEEENTDWDADPATSEGIFVVDKNPVVEVAVGDKSKTNGTSRGHKHGAKTR